MSTATTAETRTSLERIEKAVREAGLDYDSVGPCAAVVVSHEDGRYRLADDWHDESHDTADEAIAALDGWAGE